MNAAWTEVAFEDACSDVSSRAGKLPKSAWRTHGRLPVVDQGDGSIAGYTDDVDLGFRGDLPVIVFGDHTRRFKYVDHPFVVGADGVKVLRPSDGWDPRFLYWFLASLDIPSAGYSRHFRFLRRARVPLPPMSEQRRIARVLDAVDRLQTQARRAVSASSLVVGSLFDEAFGRARGSETVPLIELVAPDRPVTYGILKPGPDVPGGVPYVRVVDMEDGRIREDALRRTSPEIAREYARATLAAGDLLMSIRGHVGRLAVVPDSLAGANITQDSARLAIRGCESRFVMEAIRSPAVQAWMRQRVKGVAVQGINLADVKRIPIPQAPLPAQRAFAERAAACDRVAIAARARLRHLEALLGAVRQRAFSGAL